MFANVCNTKLLKSVFFNYNFIKSLLCRRRSNSFITHGLQYLSVGLTRQRDNHATTHILPIQRALSHSQSIKWARHTHATLKRNIYKATARCLLLSLLYERIKHATSTQYFGKECSNSRTKRVEYSNSNLQRICSRETRHTTTAATRATTSRAKLRHDVSYGGS